MKAQYTLPAYVQSPSDALWRVVESGEAFIWADTGKTIAMSGQMAMICQHILDEKGTLPSFTALLFVLDALARDTDPSITRKRLFNLYGKRPLRIEKEFESIDPILNWLSGLHRYGLDLKHGVDAQKIFLIEHLENLPSNLAAVGKVMALDAIGWMQIAHADRDVIVVTDLISSASDCEQAYRTLEYFSGQSLDEDSLRLRLQTGLDELPGFTPGDTEIPLESYKQLVDSLGDDPELGSVATMAQQAASTLALPRRPSDPDELPIGGVSDIVNRGHPERLLMTELAADSDLLLARIVNNQALYLRRESPPKNRTERRRILVENGVRTWGRARVRMACYALAVVLSEERRGKTDFNVVTVAGDKFWAEDFLSREGLVNHLERLEADAEPGGAIAKLLTDPNLSEEDEAEPLVIVCNNTFHDSVFNEKIREVPRPFLMAVVGADGHVRLLRRGDLGDDVLHQQQMTWRENSEMQRVQEKVDSRLPEFVRMRVPPLRFSSDLACEWADSHEGPVLWKVGRDQRLLCFDAHKVGAAEIMMLPSSKVVASETMSPNEVLLLVEERVNQTQKQDSAQHYVLVYASRTGERIVHRIQLPQAQHSEGWRFFFQNEALFCIGDRLMAFDIRSGERFFESTAANFTNIGGPFFADALNQVHIMSVDEPHWRLLGECPSPPGIATQTQSGAPIVFARDLSWARIFHGDNVQYWRNSSLVSSGKPPRVIAKSIAGDHVYIQYSYATIATRDRHSYLPRFGKLTFKLSTETNHIEQIPKDMIARMHPEGASLVTTKSVRNRFIGLATNGKRLFVRRNESLYFEIRPVMNPQRLALRECKDPGTVVYAPFSEKPEPDHGSMFPRRWKLRRLDLGPCVAWLDSRGLLHLRASDGSELSLVMNETHLSGWSTATGVFGTRYFTADGDREVTGNVVNWLKEYAEQCFAFDLN